MNDTSPQGKAASPPRGAGDHGGARLSRRTLLQGVVAAGLAASGAGCADAVQRPRVAPGWELFDAAVRESFQRMGMVGAAVGVVSAGAVLYTSTHGVRDQATGAPVTNDTHFLVASTTKSMSSLLVATYVDDGLLGWDQPVVEVWPEFRAPTEDLTKTLRVRDLLGMASGITEPPALSTMHEGDPTATQLLQSIVNLPVEHPPGTTFFYNNTVYAAGGYLPALAHGTVGDDLELVYSQQMHERVFGPVGMATATIADDPRGVVDDYSRGYTHDLRGRPQRINFGSVGSYAPVGGTLASLNDMMAYVRLQLRQGNSANGVDVVSAANLVECWKVHVDIPYPDPAPFDPDMVSLGYGMGWNHQRYRDGTSLISHSGGIDGFTTYIAFLPERDMGLVVLNNMNPVPLNIGQLFYAAVLNHLVSEKFGINLGVGGKIEAAYDQAVAQLRQQWAQTGPVDRSAVEPFLGYYEAGYRVSVEDGVLQVTNGSRVLPLRAMPDGSYVTTGGPFPGQPVNLTRRPNGGAQLELVELEKVNRTVGLP